MKIVIGIALAGSIVVLGNAFGSSQQSLLAAEVAQATDQAIGYVVRGKSKAKTRKARRGRGFPHQRRATGRRVFIFSPRMLAWAAYDANGRLVRTGRASGGAHYCRDIKRSCRTPRGVFYIRSKGSAHCRSSRYPLPRGGAPMPYCMFFSKYYGVHGSPNVPNYNASHGCIRVRPAAAAWLHRNFIRIGTQVIVWPY